MDAFAGSVTVADKLVGVMFVDLRRRTVIKGIRTALAGIDEDSRFDLFYVLCGRVPT